MNKVFKNLFLPVDDTCDPPLLFPTIPPLWLYDEPFVLLSCPSLLIKEEFTPLGGKMPLLPKGEGKICVDPCDVE